jgi:hypothetical protein
LLKSITLGVSLKISIHSPSGLVPGSWKQTSLINSAALLGRHNKLAASIASENVFTDISIPPGDEDSSSRDLANRNKKSSAA